MSLAANACARRISLSLLKSTILTPERCMFGQQTALHTGPASRRHASLFGVARIPSIISRAIHEKAEPALEDLKSVLPTIAANAFQAEQDRKVPAENIALLKGIGLDRAFCSPRRSVAWSCRCHSLPICIALLAGACASTAWAMSLLCTHSHQLALFSAQLQHGKSGVWTEAAAASSSSRRSVAHRGG